MELQLSVSEINELLSKAKRGSSAVRSQGQENQVGQISVRATGQLSSGQSKSISTLHEALATRSSEAFSAFLRKTVQMTLDNVEQCSYADFLKGLAQPTYIASILVPAPEGRLFLQADTSLVFPFVDMILGGTGKEPFEPRDLTQIEEELFVSAAEIVCREMQAAWRSTLDVKFQFEKRQTIESDASLLPASEQVACLTFTVRLDELEGKLRLILPSFITNALMKKAVVHMPSAEPVNAQRNQARMRERLLDSRFSTALMLPISQVSVGEVFNLKPGSVVVLETRATEPIQLTVADKSMFSAVPVRFGAMRGAQIHQVLSIAPNEKRKQK